jgi:hypothetical protein
MHNFFFSSIIANAISDNLPADLGFGMTGVNSGTLIYSVTFTIVTIITPPIVKRVGAHYYIPFLMFSWAIVTWCHAFLTVSLYITYN